jgi:hypothetical protein
MRTEPARLGASNSAWLRGEILFPRREFVNLVYLNYLSQSHVHEMSYSITERQKEIARWIGQKVREQQLEETFFVVFPLGPLFPGMASPGMPFPGMPFPSMPQKPPLLIDRDGRWQEAEKIDSGSLEALEADGLIRVAEDSNFPNPRGYPGFGRPSSRSLRCTITQKLINAIDANFQEETTVTPLSTFAHSHPPEIAISLDRLKGRYPDPKKLGFLIMRFAAAKPFTRIVTVIKNTGAKYGLIIVRADENQFHADLWGNVRTLLHGCGFGIAVYERIETDEPNANIGLEVGYLMAMDKPVLLLKDKTIETLQADLAGKLYKQFDPHDPEGSIPAQLEKWLTDNGVIVPAHAG